MRIAMEAWHDGWCEVTVGVQPAEIDTLVDLLRMIQAHPEQHFHLSSDLHGSAGVGKVTFHHQSSAEADNARISGRAYFPGETVERD